MSARDPLGSQLTESAMTEAVYQAVLSCGHCIVSESVTLEYDPHKPGHNALNQLHRRIAAALRPPPHAAAPLHLGETPWPGNNFAKRLERHYSVGVCLRPLAPADAWPLWDASRNDRFNRHLMWDKPAAPLDVLRRVEGLVGRMSAEPVSYLTVASRTNGEWLGMIRIEYVHERGVENALELGLWMHPRTWGTGIAVQVGRLATDAVFLESEVSSVLAATVEENVAATKVLYAMGFSERSKVTLPKEDGTKVPGVVLVRTREDWASAPLSTLAPTHF